MSTNNDGNDSDDNYTLRLANNPIRFEPVSKLTHVFFDDANKQVNHNMAVIVEGMVNDDNSLCSNYHRYH